LMGLPKVKGFMRAPVIQCHVLLLVMELPQVRNGNQLNKSLSC
jgi:hypothetical protein